MKPRSRSGLIFLGTMLLLLFKGSDSLASDSIGEKLRDGYVRVYDTVRGKDPGLDPCDWEGPPGEDLGVLFLHFPMKICHQGRLIPFTCSLTFSHAEWGRDYEILSNEKWVEIKGTGPDGPPVIDLLTLRNGEMLVYLDSKLKYLGTQPTHFSFKRGTVSYGYSFSPCASGVRDPKYPLEPCWQLETKKEDHRTDLLTVRVPSEEVIENCAYSSNLVKVGTSPQRGNAGVDYAEFGGTKKKQETKSKQNPLETIATVIDLPRNLERSNTHPFESCNWNIVKAERPEELERIYSRVDICMNGKIQNDACGVVFRWSRMYDQTTPSEQSPSMHLISLSNGNVLVYVDIKLQYYGAGPKEFSYAKGGLDYRFSLENYSASDKPSRRLVRRRQDGSSDSLMIEMPSSDVIAHCSAF